MSTVCANCGQVYDESGKLVCPHCGADVDLTHTETPHEMSFDDPRMGEADYDAFLEDEGLKEAGAKRSGCAGVLLFAAALGAGLEFLLRL